MLKDLIAESAKQFEELAIYCVDLNECSDYALGTVGREGYERNKKQIKAFLSAQISSAFALGEQSGFSKGAVKETKIRYEQGFSAGEESGIKKAVEIVEKVSKENDSNGRYNACNEILSALQSNLATHKP